ncbi:uncharacterized protein LOC144173874 isoform X3 [Haemaphysalis longicornis]
MSPAGGLTADGRCGSIRGRYGRRWASAPVPRLTPPPSALRRGTVTSPALATVVCCFLVTWTRQAEGSRAARGVMANTSTLLDNLLSEKNYNRQFRPGFGGPPTEILTDIEIRSFGPVSENDMMFSMDCYFRQTWYDRRLRFHGDIKVLSVSWQFLELVWKPDTFFFNGKSSYIHKVTVPNKFVRLFNDGRLMYSMRLTIKASCPMHLRKYPLDTQACPLEIGSFAYSSKEVVFKWKGPNPVVISPDVTLSQYEFLNVTASNLTTSALVPHGPVHPQPTAGLLHSSNLRTLLHDRRRLLGRLLDKPQRCRRPRRCRRHDRADAGDDGLRRAGVPTTGGLRDRARLVRHHVLHVRLRGASGVRLRQLHRTLPSAPAAEAARSTRPARGAQGARQGVQGVCPGRRGELGRLGERPAPSGAGRGGSWRRGEAEAGCLGGLRRFPNPIRAPLAAQAATRRQPPHHGVRAVQPRRRWQSGSRSPGGAPHPE